MDKWAAIAIVYNEIDFIKGWVENKRDLGFEDEDLLVMVSEKPFQGDEVEDDGTVDYLEDEDIPYITGVWPKDDPMLNAGLVVLKEYDWVLFISPDEYLTKDGFNKLKATCAKNTHTSYAVKTMNTYFKTYKHRIEPREAYHPLIAIKKGNRFVNLRSVEDDNCAYLSDDIILYHFAYYRPDFKIEQKMKNFSHAHQVIGDWYNDVWVKWTLDTKDFHPTHPGQYKGVILDEPPKEITKYLNSHSLFSKE